MIKSQDLEKKGWYRFLKVGYIFFYMIFIIIVPLVIYSEFRPFHNPYLDVHTVVCNNGSEFRIKNNDTVINGILAEKTHKDAKVLCSFTRLQWEKVGSALTDNSYDYVDAALENYRTYSTDDYLTLANSGMNYKLVTQKHVEGTWSRFNYILALSLVGVIILMGIVRIVFLYIVTGEKPITLEES